MGYSFCFFLSIHVFGNILFILSMSLKSALWGLKKYWHVKKHIKKNNIIKIENQERRDAMIKRFLMKRGEGDVASQVYQYHDKNYSQLRIQKLNSLMGLGILTKINQDLDNTTQKQVDKNVMYDSMQGWEPSPTKANLDKRVKHREKRLNKLKQLMNWDREESKDGSTANEKKEVNWLSDFEMIKGYPLAVLKVKLQDKDFETEFRKNLTLKELLRLNAF